METWQGREALILSGAPGDEILYVKRFLADHPDIRIVCADAGLRHLETLGVSPDLLVGDFDSGFAPNHNCEIIRLIPEKDDTDTMHALQVVIARGCRKIWIACATGGRLDHLLANLSLCEYAAEHGCACSILDAQNLVQLIASGSAVYVPGNTGYRYFSIIPLDKRLQGLSISGAKYPVQNAAVDRSQMYTVSNEVTANEAIIRIEAGCALLICAKDK